MNINKLQKEMVIKNYKELCNLLGEAVKGGKSRTYQLKEMERYFSYHKEGNKFIIDEIYKTPLEKQDGRKEVSENDPRRDGVNSIYRDDISELILNLLSQSKDGEVFLSTGKLLGLLKMVNNNYSHGRRNIPKLSEILGIGEDHIYLFYNTTQSKLKSNLESALNYLRRKSKIVWETVTTVCEKKIIMEFNELGNPRLDSNEKIIYKTINNHRPATTEEHQLILRAEEDIMEDLGCRDFKDVFVKGYWNTFRSKVNKRIRYEGNIEYFYDSYRIIYNHDSILKELDAIERTNTEKRLNSNITYSLKDSAKKHHEKAKNKIEEVKAIVEFGWGDCKVEELPQTTQLQGSDEYLDNNDILIHNIINPNADDISKELYKPLVPKEKENEDTNDESNEIPF